MTAICPCCRQPVSIPPLHALLDGLPSHSAAVLKTVWHARGLPVRALAMFDAMYVDDPDGGPSQSRMYLDLREAVARLNDVAGRSGVVVLYCGRAKGWRLEILEGGADDLPMLQAAGA